MPKFLVLRFSSIGDIVLTSPVLRCLRNLVPGAEIHFVCKEAFRPVLENNPNIDRLFSFREDSSEILKELRMNRYDAVIDLHHNLRSLGIKRRMNTRSFSFPKLNVEKWLMVNFKINHLPNVHLVDRYMETLVPLGVKNDGKGLDYFTSPEDEKILQRIPESSRENYIGFVIGAKHITKKMPLEKIIALVRNIRGPVILLGGSEDKQAGDQISLAAGSHVFNACGLSGINESAVLVKHARKIITHDTGLMHIAAAYQKEIAVIWGNTIPGFGMYPYYGERESNKSHSFEVNNLRCRPCSKIGFAKCPRGHFHCMNLQNIQSIADWANA